MQTFDRDRTKVLESLNQNQISNITNDMKNIIRGRVKDASATNRVFAEFIDIAIVLSKEKFFKNKNLNEVANSLLDLIEKKKIYFGISDHVPCTIVAGGIQKDGKTYLTIIAPSNWGSLLREDPDYQMGSVIYIASHCKDYSNNINLKEESKKVQERAMSFEAELINYLKANKNKVKINQYQESICEKFPNGVSSCTSHY